MPVPPASGPSLTAPILPTSSWLTVPAFVLAVAVPTWLAFNVPPSATLLNQLLSVFGWGVVLLLAAVAYRSLPPRGLQPRAIRNRTAALWVVLAGVSYMILVSWLFNGLPTSLALPAFALVWMAVAVVWQGAATGASDAAAWSLPPAPAGVPAARAAGGFAPFAWALLAAGLVGTLIGLLQVFAPGWLGGDDMNKFIAESTLPGRAVGNLRQPNHLSSVLVWALIAVVPLVETQRLPRRAGLLLSALLVFGVVLTASRTGLVGIGLIALWGLLDRQLSRPVRGGLMATPLAYGAGWLAMALWAIVEHAVFGGEARLAETDLSSSRFGIWRNTLQMIHDQPWTGVGWGQFNFAWTLSVFPHRPTAFFDHTHNLPLQFAVEFGIPVALLLTGLLLVALWQAWRRACVALPMEAAAAAAAVGSGMRGDAGVGVSARAAVMLIVLIGLHSLLEYPLWYAYFLLPAAWAWGYALACVPSQPAAGALPAAPVAAARWQRPVLRLVGAVMIASALFALWDYWKVVVIFQPDDDAAPLPQRIVRGENALLFSHHAFYAAVTYNETQAAPLWAFRGAVESLLDTRLLAAWSRALYVSDHAGDHKDAALYVAARLREFRREESRTFFDGCGPAKPAAAQAGRPASVTAAAPARDPLLDASGRPFQCQLLTPPAPGHQLPIENWTWRDFRFFL